MTISKRMGEMAIGLAFALVGTVWLIVALDYDVGTLTMPGAGFFPIGLSLLLACTGLWVAASAATRRAPSDQLVGDADAQPVDLGGASFLVAIGALVFVTLLFERLGFVAVTALLLIALFRQFGRFPWRYVVPGSVVASLVAYIGFVEALGVRLPGFME